jgi:hypothetical protein
MHAESTAYCLPGALQKVAQKVNVIPNELYYPIIHQLKGVRRGEVFDVVRHCVDQTIPERNIINYLQSYAKSIS